MLHCTIRYSAALFGPDGFLATETALNIGVDTDGFPMSYQINFEQKDDYMHIVVTGTKSTDTIRSFHADICTQRENHGYSRILVEQRLEGPAIPTFELYELVAQASQKAAGKYDAIAYVDEARDTNLSFAETVAVNRGAAVATFGSIDAADRWLTSGPEERAEKNLIFGRERRNGG